LGLVIFLSFSIVALWKSILTVFSLACEVYFPFITVINDKFEGIGWKRILRCMNINI
jgi:hypothetical protein